MVKIKKTFLEITGMTEMEWMVNEVKELMDSLDIKRVEELEIDETDREINIRIKLRRGETL